MSFGAGPDFRVDPVGQATGNSCQSYVLANALAYKKDKAFRIETSAELRDTERQIRKAIELAASTHPDNPGVNHDDIRRGFEAYTSNVYTVKTRDLDLVALSDAVGKRSGITSAALVPPTFLFGSVVADVAISSAKKIGGYSYADGHLFSILGIDGPPDSSRRFLVLNSAVKVKDIARNACIDGVPDDSGPYTASIKWYSQSEIDFKTYGGKLKLWTVEKK